MRNDLHRFSEIIAPAFFVDDRLIDLATGQIVVTRKNAVGETFVMSKVEVGFGAIVQNINFAMLKRAHRSRIHVEIRIKFLENNAEPA